jgi:aspartate-semialdehyde dehydrogenase
LHDLVGLRRARVSTYQAVSGAGAQRMERLRSEPPEEHDLEFDWTWESDETDEEAKIRAESRKILELPELPLSATTVRVPVLVGHAQSVWIETEEPISPEQAVSVLDAAPGVRLVETPTPGAAAQTEDVLVGRVRPDRASDRDGLVLFLACDNLVKGAALNAIQIAELLLEPARATA